MRERCAAIDVGKRDLAVALAAGPVDKEAEIKTRAFGTTVPAIEELRQWLVEERCTSVAIESTGPYWIPVKNVLEGVLEIMLVCARKHHPRKREKTDFHDAIGLVHYHRHGLLSGKLLEASEVADLAKRRRLTMSRALVSLAERGVHAEQEADRDLRAAYQRFVQEQDHARKEEAGKDLIRAIFGKDAIAGDRLL